MLYSLWYVITWSLYLFLNKNIQVCDNCLFLLHVGGKEHAKRSYEVLVADCHFHYEWVRSSNGQVPRGAIQGGHTNNGESLYIGRIKHERTWTPGKIHPSHGSLYIAYGGYEIRYQCGYEILIKK